VDGIHAPPVTCSVQTIIKGDDKEPAISAASILAKVTRDAEMVVLDGLYPGYGLAQHKGYPTADHLQALAQLGVTRIHRKSFSPVAQLLKKEHI
jgi:ribonuclease HII